MQVGVKANYPLWKQTDAGRDVAFMLCGALGEQLSWSSALRAYHPCVWVFPKLIGLPCSMVAASKRGTDRPESEVKL